MIMKKENKIFSSKVLLFGEYILLCGAQALSIPFDKYSGYFTFSNSQTESNKSLKKFLDYLKNINDKLHLNLSDFEKDILKGLTFKSNIPHGYGLGSSGSLSAAVYDKYALNKIENSTASKKDINFLKNIFGLMESFFHGKSSGLDPLISYLKEPILVQDKNNINKVILPVVDNTSKAAVFLLDYGKSGDTGPLVKDFMERCNNKLFKEKIINEMIPVSNRCIELFIKGKLEETIDCVKELSQNTVSIFNKMVPEGLLKHWKQGLETGDYYLKLCGSGGGGMMLGFTRNFTKAQEKLKPFQVHKIF